MPINGITSDKTLMDTPDENEIPPGLLSTERRKALISPLSPSSNVRMQGLMEDSGAYVFLTHELNAAIYRDHLNPGLLPDGTARFAEFQLARS